MLFIALAILLVIIVGIAALIYSNYKKNQETVYYSELEDCSLPTLSMIFNGQEINRIFGYTQEMDYQYMRDTIYVMESGFDIEVTGNLYGNTIKKMEFSLYDMAEQKLIQSSEVENFTTDGDELHAVLTVENLIEEGQEYFIDIRLLDGKDRTIHYYSRVMKNTTSTLDVMMELVLEHHAAMYDKSKADLLEEYQEPNSAVNDSTNFGDISLSSTVASMSWGTMNVTVITEPVLSIVDLDNDIAFFRLDYQVGRTTETGKEEYINVSEYYKTRTYGEKKYILSYERTANEIFIPDASSIGNKSVLIGIAEDLDIQTMTNAEGNLNVFVAGKAVWFMDTTSKTLQKVFSFETDPTDIRQNYSQHDIKLLKTTEEGDFQFLVYGYMNRGIHEGQTGIALYTYSAEENEVIENIFIPSYLPYQVLKNSIGSLCYLNNEGNLYILLDEFVYKLDPDANKATLLVSGLNENNFKVSANGRMLAWQEEALENTAVKINVMDLETEESYSVQAGEGSSIKALGFLDTNLVYGEGKTGNTYTTAEGQEYLLMSNLYVVDSSRNVLTSENSQNGYFITSVVEYNRVVVQRMLRVGNEYKEGDEFTLFATDLDDYQSASAYNTYDEDKRTVNYVEVVNTMDANKEAVINDNMKITLCSAETTDIGDMISDSGKYYVYVAGNIEAILTNPAEAVMKAYYSTGVVVTSEGYFYKRASRPTTVELTDTSIKKAVEAYKNNTALNMTGIYLTQALYYTGRKIPVIWEWYDTTYIIYGYDLYDNLMLYDVNSGAEILVAYEDVDEVFDIAGRCFIVES